MNEKLSPNLMVCKSEIVECIIEQMHEMEENISRAKKGDIKVSRLAFGVYIPLFFLIQKYF